MFSNKTRVAYVLLAFLAVFYLVNIFVTRNIITSFVDTPIKLSFLILEPPQEGCENCFDGNNIIKMIDAAHNVKYKTQVVPYDSALSQKNIEMYNIQNLPAVIVSGDITNEKVTSAWTALAGEERGGNMVIENRLPYYDIKTATVKGVVNMVILKDGFCDTCFDENGYIDMMTRLGLVTGKINTYDISSEQGRDFVQKYSITKIPALILSPDVGDYASFEGSWKEVGTVETDGWYIFREVQKLSSDYKNI